ncbi:MAG: hypothetical protein B7X39_18985 [Lysobacterales bacterium 14-68-21]|nr:MAG: hypothetical protein B7X45_14950 [Xanthomonadales bacterium 15-68-25]OZB63621.1 MAG: hypothetical protein B7X39_18985 [Xanthomonadales bacterium 14-68-21]
MPFALALAAITTASAATLPTASPPALSQPEVINGVAIRSGIERLSYISLRYYGIRPAYEACIKQSQGALPARQDCADAEFAYQDARLNRIYKSLLANLTRLDKHAAIEAQRAWLTFRDKDCSARAGRFGSDAGPATESTCRMESTAYRAQQLDDWRNTLAKQPSR